jgi:hypothetical protein
MRFWSTTTCWSANLITASARITEMMTTTIQQRGRMAVDVSSNTHLPQNDDPTNRDCFCPFSRQDTFYNIPTGPHPMFNRYIAERSLFMPICYCCFAQWYKMNEWILRKVLQLYIMEIWNLLKRYQIFSTVFFSLNFIEPTHFTVDFFIASIMIRSWQWD